MAAVWPFGLYRVEGESMQPTYHPGDTLLGWKWFRPKSGRIVVAYHDGRMIIKRLAAVSGSNITLLGDNLFNSVDSRHYGPVPASELQAIIIAKL